MKKFSLLCVICLMLFAGCTDNVDKEGKVIDNEGEVVADGVQRMHCTRSATASSGIEVELGYDLYYTGDSLKILHSVEKVVSSDEESLDLYQDAYQKIQDNYKGLDFYEAKVIRNKQDVTSDITINYEKIDIEKLLAIEGEEDNIIENGEAKVSKWKALAEKFGTECEAVKN